MGSAVNYDSFKNKNRREILREFLKLITVYDNKGKSRQTHLKVFIIRTINFSVKQIEEYLKSEYFNGNNSVKSFLNQNQIFIELLNSEENKTNYYLKLENVKTKKRYHFVIFENSNYWSIITLVKREDLDMTLLTIIRLIKDVEVIKITTKHLEDLILNQNYENAIGGFIAKYKPYYSDRHLTVEMHGGDLIDLNKLREIYLVEPTSFNFRLRNSPVEVVKGNILYEGNFSLEKILDGYQNIAVETIEKLIESFESINEMNYERVLSFENVPKLIKNGKGLRLKSRYAVVIKIKKERFKLYTDDKISERDKITYEELNETIIKFFKFRARRYEIYSEAEFSHFICDKETRNKVQLTLEPKDSNIIIYPFRNCRGKTLRDICNGINEVENSIEQIQPYFYTS